MITLTCEVPTWKEWPSFAHTPVGMGLGIQDLVYEIRSVVRCGVIDDGP